MYSGFYPAVIPSPAPRSTAISRIVSQALARKELSAQQEHEIAVMLRSEGLSSDDLDALDRLYKALRDRKIIYAQMPWRRNLATATFSYL